MTLKERLRQLAFALPFDDSTVSFTRAALMALLEDGGKVTEVDSTRDLTVEEVAHETHRARSTIRGWLGSGALRGHKFHGDWRVTRAALREYLEAQATHSSEAPGKVDITAWRNGGDT